MPVDFPRRQECLPDETPKSAFDEFLRSKTLHDGQIKIEIADWSAVPEDLTLNSEMKEILGRAIGELPPSYLSVVKTPVGQ
jgi:hypothetical protein